MLNPVVNRLGFWTALSVAFLNLWFYIAFIPEQPILTTPWSGLAVYAQTFRPTTFLAWVVPAFLLAPAQLTMIFCLHFKTVQEKHFWSLFALVFIGVYAAILAPLYYIQMTVVRDQLITGPTDDLLLWLYTYHYPYNIPGALEATGYSFLSAAFLFAAGVFGSGRLQRWLHWTFIGVGISGLPLFIDPLIRLPFVLLVVDGLIYGVLGILAPVLLAIFFKITFQHPYKTGLAIRGAEND
jgi:hypothetical protein